MFNNREMFWPNLTAVFEPLRMLSRFQEKWGHYIYLVPGGQMKMYWFT